MCLWPQKTPTFTKTVDVACWSSSEWTHTHTHTQTHTHTHTHVTDTLTTSSSDNKRGESGCHTQTTKTRLPVYFVLKTNALLVEVLLCLRARTGQKHTHARASKVASARGSWARTRPYVLLFLAHRRHNRSKQLKFTATFRQYLFASSRKLTREVGKVRFFPS